MKRLAILFTFLPLFALAQTNSQAGFLLDFNTSEYLRKAWFLKLKAQTRLSAVQSENFELVPDSRELRRVDFQALAENKISSTRSLAFGAMYRYSDQQDLIRFIQQKAWVNEAYKAKVGHRFRLDQSLRSSDDLEMRFRYRLGLQFSLDGFRLDEGEKYVMWNTELLYKTRTQQSSVEARLVLTYGTVMKNGGKNEIGFDYRLDGLNQDAQEHQVWLTYAFFFRKLR